MKNKFLYIYYFVLILVLILYTNMSGSPSMIIRLGYLAALAVPLLNNVVLFPAILICSLGISKYTFAYPLLPTDMDIYVILSVAFAFLALSRSRRTAINPLFFLILFYITVNDLLFKESLSNLVTMLFIVILFYFCTEGKLDTSIKFLPLAFILISLAISYWRLFCPDAMTLTYNAVDGIAQVGWMDPNYLGCALGMGLVLSVSGMLEERRTKRFYIFLLTVIASLLAILGLASRGMALAAAISVAVLLLFSKVNARAKTLTILSIAVFLIFLYTNQYFDFLLSRFNADNGTGANRTVIWGTKLSAFFNEGNPLNWVFGMGQKAGIELGYNSWFSSGMSTHNDFISVLIYYGFVGIVLFACAIAYPLKVCSKESRPKIAAFILYLVACSMTIEPLARGNIAYLGFFFYITQLARQSRQIQAAYE